MLFHFQKCVMLLAALVAGAAAVMAANITGTVKDNAGEVLPEASVRILRADSSYVSGTSTSASGKFRFGGINKGRYILEVSYIGYARYYKDITVGNDNLRLGDITMNEEANMLKEISVTGIRTPIKVMEDTIEYNAGTYKTQPNAVVEDLLKRLPGVEVGTDGKITVNGKEVSKILLDGQEFFSDDPTVASKNLPVEMVDRVQVVDRKSDLARLTGVDDGEDETVINLSIKPGMKNGWVGNAEAGYGTDNRYQGSFMVNRFNGNNQFTFLGNLNNVNNLGFSDGGSRFRRFGGTNGITTSRSLGFNFNVGKTEDFRVGGNLLYSNTDRDTRTRQERQYLFTDSTAYTSTGKNTRDRGHNVRGDFRIQWKPDEYNTLEVRPNFSVNLNKSLSADSTLTRAGDPSRTLVSRSTNTDNTRGNSFEAGLRVIYNHKFASHPGRSLSVMANYQYSNMREKEDAYSLNNFYQLDDSVSLYDQYSNNHTWSHTAGARVTWTEPLGDVKDGNFLTLAYRMSYRWNDADKMTYDHPVMPGVDGGEPWIDYDRLVWNDTLSNRFRNNYFNQDIRLGYKRVKKAYTLDLGLSLVPQMSQSTDLINSARNIERRWVWNVAPFIRYKYKMGKSRSIDVRYNGRSSQPTMTQLQPVADYSDPLRVVIGNPNLDPTFTHRANIRFQDFNADKQRSIMLMAFADLTQNSIVSKTTFDPTTGGQTTTYTNVNGVWSARLMNMFSQPLRNRAFQFTNNMHIAANRNIGFNNGSRNASLNFMIGESFAFAWRPDRFELELRPYYNLQLTKNTLQTNADRTVHTYGGRFDGTYITPFGLTFNTDVSFAATRGYASGYDRDQWMWNASLSYEFLKSKSATIALKVYDILQQRESIRRNVTANYIEDAEYNTLSRYFMVTFTYKFNTFGKGNEPKMRDNGNRFGGPGRPGPR